MAVDLPAGEPLAESSNRIAGQASRGRVTGTEGREICRCASGADEAGIESYVSSFICHSLAGSRLRHSNGAGTSRPQRREYDDDLYPCAEPRAVRCSQPLR